MYLRSGFTFSESSTTISIFLPITSVYTSAIVKDVIANKEIRKTFPETIFYRIRLIICYNNIIVHDIHSGNYHHQGL
jgi:hypothetical protein